MNIFDSRGLKDTAASRLSEAAYNPRLLVLIHTGISLGSALLVAVLSYILEQKIAATGGLSGIGLRSVLTTAQSFLQLVLMLLTPFWGIGIVYAAIGLARGQTAAPKDLTAGFQRFGPVLRLKLLQLFLYGALAMPCMYVSAGIFSITPLSRDFQELIFPIWEQAMVTGQIAQLDAATMDAILQTMLPLIPIFILLYLAAFLPLMYRLRMAEYVIMNDAPCGAMQALIASWKMTRGRASALLKLDLSFWWFYGLQVLAIGLAYCDQLLPLLGISLPIPADGAYFLFYGLYIVAELALFWRFGGYLHTTYAVAYEALRHQLPVPQQNPFPDQPEQM